MEDPRPDIDRWLASEHEGEDAAAEQAFARVLQGLPRIEPRADFSDRVVTLAWQLERRRRRTVRVALVAAALFVAAAGISIGYLAVLFAGTSAVEAAAALVARGVVIGISIGDAAIRWWSLGARVASTVQAMLATSQNMAALLAIELVGLGAAIGLKQMLANRHHNGRSTEVRV